MIQEYTIDEDKMRSYDRVMHLAPTEGKTAKSVTGQLDNRLFTGEQTLHCKMNMETNLWTFQYGQKGLLPGGLEGQFTSFSKAFDHAKGYFEKRNVQITEVKD